MSNLLPREAQKDVWRMYRGRFVSIGSLIALSVALLAGVALLPMYFTLHATDSTLSEPVQKKNIDENSERTEVGRMQLLLSTLSPLVTASTTPSQIIAIALRLRPKGVFVDNIVFSSALTKEMVITGHSDSREAVNAYQQALQSDFHFKTATIPVRDLAGTREGRFTVTLTGSF